ncbi:MAG: VOC family protein [Gammaproteobacteria bacterium]|nr:VOC family protein [Gammaproteobacteria bacterium]
MPLAPFHLAIPVSNLARARRFYGLLLGCEEGRSSNSWVDFDFFGHQLVCHLDENLASRARIANLVDGKQVPVPHFGVVLEMKVWQHLAQRLQERKVSFLIEPYVRFEGLPGEQATLFILDPSGNALEFKAFQNIQEQLFKKP